MNVIPTAMRAKEAFNSEESRIDDCDCRCLRRKLLRKQENEDKT